MHPTHPGPAMPDDRHDHSGSTPVDQVSTPSAEDPATEPFEFDEPTCICDPDATRQIVVVWADDGNEPAHARIFTPDQYADWAETNYLTGAFSWPVAFYGVFATGELAELVCTGEVGAFDVDDYAPVTYAFTLLGHSRPVTIGVTRRDGRA